MSVKFGNRAKSDEKEMIPILRSVDISIQTPWLMHLKIELSTNLGKSDISNVKADSIRVKTQIDPQHELINTIEASELIPPPNCWYWTMPNLGNFKKNFYEIRLEFCLF